MFHFSSKWIKLENNIHLGLKFSITARKVAKVYIVSLYMYNLYMAARVKRKKYRQYEREKKWRLV